MAYCYQMKMFCEFAALEGYCRSSACRKAYNVTYEVHTMTPMTNADRIRAMSDEDLAAWLVKKTVYQESAFSHPSYLNFMTGSDDTKESAIKGTVKWLKQPAEEVSDG